MKLLLVEDDAELSEHLATSLQCHGFLVSHIYSQSELDTVLVNRGPVDMVILDRLLGSNDSKDSLLRIRATWPSAPILVISAISTPNERTDLINMGADDYLGKPFSTQELIARIRSLFRRSSILPQNYLQVGNLVIDYVKRIISVENRVESLPTKEFLILKTLTQERGRIWSRSELLDYVWGAHSTVETNVVEATIANVRKKLADLGAKVSIKNMRNAGYWLEE